jgi:Ca2+-binding RTX toxin-like protein
MSNIFLVVTLFIMIMFSCLIIPQQVNANIHIKSNRIVVDSHNPQITKDQGVNSNRMVVNTNTNGSQTTPTPAPGISIPGAQMNSGIQFIRNLLVPPCEPTSSNDSNCVIIPKNPLTTPDQVPIISLNQTLIAAGLNAPKNLQVGSVTCTAPDGKTQACPVITGNNGPDIIIATPTPNAQIFGLGGNDFIQCGPNNCKVLGGPGDNIMLSGSSSSAELYGGFGNNIFIGGTGDTLMVGGKGNDQFYAGSGHDVMIGGGGHNYFDCGSGGSGTILDFNAKYDIKAPDCKYVITVRNGIPPLP